MNKQDLSERVQQCVFCCKHPAERTTVTNGELAEYVVALMELQFYGYSLQIYTQLGQLYKTFPTCPECLLTL